MTNVKCSLYFYNQCSTSNIDISQCAFPCKQLLFFDANLKCHFIYSAFEPIFSVHI